ncbi:MAG: polyketide antibiotic transporter [Salinibacterium sp.]|nr:polyketide antibiotic transporter [Salinibacterium sp.]MBF0671944.1 polyketide antibiotic transporter [Salinibacterium sp.]
MSGVLRLARAQARRDRWTLPLWIVGIAVLGLAAGSAVAAEFGDEAERAAIVAVAAANPAFLFLRGLPDGLSIGSVVFFQAYAFTAVLAGLMNTFLVVRHTRADEELGRGELIGATPVSRAAPLVATVLLAVAANTALAAAVALGYLGGGLPLGGSIAAAAAVASVGLVFAAVAAVLCQLMPTGRSSNGAAAALVGLAYLLRGTADALGTPNPQLTRVETSPLSWLSPIGWGQQVRPYSEPTLAPLLLALGVAAALLLLAVTLRARRDLGDSLLPERPGRATAGLGGNGVVGLAWRLQRGAAAGWCVGGAALGLVAGGLAPVVANAVEGNASLAELIGSLVPGTQADIVDIFTAALLGMAGVLAGAAGVQAVLRLRSEEAEGRAEILLATPLSRARWVGASLAIAAASTLAVSTVAGAAAGSLVATSSGDPALLGRFVGAALAHVPAAIVFVALAALVFALAPRLTTTLGWGLLALGLVLGQFGELLRIPEWAQNMSPYRHASAVPVEDFDVASAIVLSVVAVGLAAVAMVGTGRRDLAP